MGLVRVGLCTVGDVLLGSLLVLCLDWVVSGMYWEVDVCSTVNGCTCGTDLVGLSDCHCRRVDPSVDMFCDWSALVPVIVFFAWRFGVVRAWNAVRCRG